MRDVAYRPGDHERPEEVLGQRGDQRLYPVRVALCGRCGGAVHVGGNKGYPVYRCADSTGHFSRKAQPIDDYITAIMKRRLAMPDAAELFAPPGKATDKSELHREADRIRTKLDGLAELYTDGTLTAKGVRESSERLKTQLEEVEDQAGGAERRPEGGAHYRPGCRCPMRRGMRRRCLSDARSSGRWWRSTLTLLVAAR